MFILTFIPLLYYGTHAKVANYNVLL